MILRMVMECLNNEGLKEVGFFGFYDFKLVKKEAK